MPLVEYVKVIDSSAEESPACRHGPALLFDRVGKRFFACSACRDRKLCSLYVEFGSKKPFKTWRRIRDQFVPKANHIAPPAIADLHNGFFCSNCCRIFSGHMCSHDGNSELLRPVSQAEATSPSTFLAQLSANKGHAQYHFDEATLEFIVGLASKFDKVLCVGTPSVFEQLRCRGVRCHLADIDRRLEAFYSREEFTWFNMFNGLAFRDNEDSALWRYVESKSTAVVSCGDNLLSSSSSRLNQFSDDEYEANEDVRQGYVSCAPHDVTFPFNSDVIRRPQRSIKRPGSPSLSCRRRAKKLKRKHQHVTPNETEQTKCQQNEIRGKFVSRHGDNLLNHSGQHQHDSMGHETDEASLKSEKVDPLEAVEAVVSGKAPRERFGEALLIVDPPFGALLAPLAKTINKLTRCGSWNTVLVYPYFNEAQVKLHFPTMAMCDLAVRYRNQRKMKDDSSPVRIFTDIPLNWIALPQPAYKFCTDCDRWVHTVNVHCPECGVCPSKNHAATRHCGDCHRCVKQTWLHCTRCSRCHLPGECGARRDRHKPSPKLDLSSKRKIKRKGKRKK